MKKDVKNKRYKKFVAKPEYATAEEYAEEERLYNACKKPVKIGWMIYGLAATMYLSTGIFAKNAVDKIPQKPPIEETLSSYTEQYNDFIIETQKEALDRFTNGDISADEYQYIIDQTSDEKNFEQFLRNLEEDEYVQKVIADYDKYAEQMNSIGKKYSALSITSLSSLLVATLILAKYRFREMDIEEVRKKRAELPVFEEEQMK